MSEELRGVVCSLSDCLYHVKLPNQPSRTFCRHPEIETNPAGTRCPFYRMDWQRKTEEMSRRFSVRRT